MAVDSEEIPPGEQCDACEKVDYLLKAAGFGGYQTNTETVPYASFVG